MKKRILGAIGVTGLILMGTAFYLLSGGQSQEAHAPTDAMPNLTMSEASDSRIAALLKKMEDGGKIPKLDRSASLAGPDANGDGIRDDIEAMIVAFNRTPEETQALRQLAKAFQIGMTKNIRTREEAKLYADNVGRGTGCVFHRFGEQGAQYTSMIGDSVINTRTRKLEEHRVDALLSGGVFSTFGASGCE